MLSTKLITLTLIVQSVIVCCSSVVSAEELFDFEFENDVKRSAEAPTTTASSTQLDGAFEDFLDDMGSAESGEESLNLQEKERLVKAELVRAWKNPKMKRKFAEVLPILKVMSSQQKIALAALVSAQIGAKQGRELNLNQVSGSRTKFNSHQFFSSVSMNSVVCAASTYCWCYHNYNFKTFNALKPFRSFETQL